MKVIDLLNGIANGKYDDFKTKFIENGEVYNMRTFKNLYILDDGVLNLEIKLLDKEDDFIDIEEMGLFDLTMDEIETDEYGNITKLGYTGVSDTVDKMYDVINDLIKNQKLLIDKINKLEGK